MLGDLTNCIKKFDEEAVRKQCALFTRLTFNGLLLAATIFQYFPFDLNYNLFIKFLFKMIKFKT